MHVLGPGFTLGLDSDFPNNTGVITVPSLTLPTVALKGTVAGATASLEGSRWSREFEVTLSPFILGRAGRGGAHDRSTINAA